MTLALDETTAKHLRHAADELAREFAGTLPRETVDRQLDESLRDLASARVPDFVPVLAHRFARERLRELASAGDPH